MSVSAAPLAVPSSLSARLTLDFARDPSSGETLLHSSIQEPPLQIVRAFPREDGSSLAHLHNVSGGLLGGDDLSLSATLAPETQVQLTTTGATRLYRPRADAAPARQCNQIHVGENAILEYVPDPIIPYADVRFEQRSEIHLAPGAGLFWWEMLAPGREARGEAFAYERIEMRTDIFARSRPIAAERVRLEPRVRPLNALARLGDFRYWITFYICRVRLEPANWLALENELRETLQTHTATSSRDMLWGISTLPVHGLVIRGLARSAHPILDALHCLWRTAKSRLYTREPILPRKLP